MEILENCIRFWAAFLSSFSVRYFFPRGHRGESFFSSASLPERRCFLAFPASFAPVCVVATKSSVPSISESLRALWVAFAATPFAPCFRLLFRLWRDCTFFVRAFFRLSGYGIFRQGASAAEVFLRFPCDGIEGGTSRAVRALLADGIEVTL